MSQRIDFLVALLTTDDPKELASSALRWIVSEIQSQEDLLTRLSLDVKHIKEGPYYAGLVFLKEADRRTTDVDRIKDVEKARDRFIDALSMQRENQFLRSIIRFNIGETYALLGEKDLAREDLVESYRWAVEARRKLRERQKKVGEIEAALVISTLGLAGVFTADLTERQLRGQEDEILDFLANAKTLLTKIGVDTNMLPPYDAGIYIPHIETAKRIDRIMSRIRRLFGGS